MTKPAVTNRSNRGRGITVKAVVWFASFPLLALLLVALAGCGDADTVSTSGPQSGSSVDDIYDRILDHIHKPGSILHTRIRATIRIGSESTPAYTKDLWIDADREAVREEFHKDPVWEGAEIDDESVAIYVGPYVYAPDDPGEALRFQVEETCPGSDSVILSRLLECGFFSPHASELGEAPEVELNAEYEGRPAIAILFSNRRELEPNDGLSRPSSATATPEPDGSAQGIEVLTESRVYLAPETFLPIAHLTEFYRDGQLYGGFLSVYEHDFVSPNSLPDDLLDPRSIGYGAENADALLEQISYELPVYWLGHEFEPGGDVHPLVLTRVDTGQGSSMGRHLYYETPTGVPAVYVFLWKPNEWEEFMGSPQGRFLSDTRCVEPRQLDVEGKTVVVYALPELDYPLPSTPVTAEQECQLRVVDLSLMMYKLVAVVPFDDVVIDLRSDVVGYYNSLEAIQAILRGVHPR